jgi:hypothetical protein
MFFHDVSPRSTKPMALRHPVAAFAVANNTSAFDPS